jgi:hypothetical protein
MYEAKGEQVGDDIGYEWSGQDEYIRFSDKMVAMIELESCIGRSS